LDVSDPVNLGVGRETRIRDLAELIARLTGFEGELVWDASKPDGQPKRYLDVSRARDLMGFEATVELEDGLARTIESFRGQTAGVS
jgi:GDP-L-fucose synthase